MRRSIVCLLVVLALLVVAEPRLSHGGHSFTEPPPPELWENAQPPGRPSPPPVVTRAGHGLTVTYSGPAMNCATIVSTDPNSHYALTAVENGVRFDIDGDGDLDEVAWTEPATDAAFLARDRDGDGRITSGRELIGDQTVPGVANGPNALMRLAVHSGTGAPAGQRQSPVRRVAAMEGCQSQREERRERAAAGRGRAVDDRPRLSASPPDRQPRQSIAISRVRPCADGTGDEHGHDARG